MSDQKNFITRWSRRKCEAADDNAQADQPAAQAAGKPAAPGEEVNQTVAARATAPPAPEFDLSSLPSIESIGVNSDISAFLHAGVPSAIRNAALRRAWVADPAIRDFVGLAENTWDFTAPEGVPGFGDLDPQLDIKKLVAEIFGEAQPESKSPADSTIPAPTPEQATRLSDQSDNTPDVLALSEPVMPQSQQFATTPSGTLLQRNEHIATQHDDSQKMPKAMKARRHGNAKPQ